MSDLSRLVDAPGAPYLGLRRSGVSRSPAAAAQRAAAPLRRRYAGMIVHHGVGRNGRDYRDYWLRLVNEAGILAIAVEFTEEAFPDYLWYHFGNLHDGRARRTRASNGPMASTNDCSPRCASRG